MKNLPQTYKSQYCWYGQIDEQPEKVDERKGKIGAAKRSEKLRS